MNSKIPRQETCCQRVLLEKSTTHITGMYFKVYEKGSLKAWSKARRNWHLQPGNYAGPDGELLAEQWSCRGLTHPPRGCNASLQDLSSLEGAGAGTGRQTTVAACTFPRWGLWTALHMIHRCEPNGGTCTSSLKASSLGIILSVNRLRKQKRYNYWSRLYGLRFLQCYLTPLKSK